MDWITAFILTLLIEFPVLLFLLKDQDTLRVLGCGFLMNLLSHPLLWFILPQILPGNYFILCGELLVIAMEYLVLTLFFRHEQKVKLMITASIVNLLSFLIGETIYLF